MTTVDEIRFLLEDVEDGYVVGPGGEMPQARGPQPVLQALVDAVRELIEEAPRRADGCAGGAATETPR